MARHGAREAGFLSGDARARDLTFRKRVKSFLQILCAYTRRKTSPGRGGAWIEGDSIRGIRGPSKSGGGRLANIESTPYNLLRCPTRGPQVAREVGQRESLYFQAWPTPE